jgi:hypothetical protein
MSAAPLTHHEILRLVEPFTRVGRRVDLTGSDRVRRRLEFKPVERIVPIDPNGGPIRPVVPIDPNGGRIGPVVPIDPNAGRIGPVVSIDPNAGRGEPVVSIDPGGDIGGRAVLEDALTLDCLSTGSFRLTRRLTLAGRATACYEGVGVALAKLLAAVEGVPAELAFRHGPGYLIARSYSLEAVRARAPQNGWHLVPILVRGIVHLDGLSMTLSLPTVRGIAADIEIGPLDLPEDLLAVLGWDWARLVRLPDGWKSKLRLRGNLSTRSRRAELALERAAAHVARTLAEPPALFHDRWRAARWGVMFRRGIPLLTFGALIIVIAMLGRSGIARGVGPWMLLFQLPTALIALSLSLQELARYEIPPWPRRSQAVRWRGPP